MNNVGQVLPVTPAAADRWAVRFLPFASLVKAGIHVDTICSTKTIEGHVSAFLLTHPGRKPTVMTWTESGGSGGVSSWITLKLDAEGSNLCKS